MTDKTTLLFTEEHEWVEILEDDTVRIGISDYATEELGDVVFVELPEEDSKVEENEEFATVESVKSSSEIYSPVSGTVTGANEALEDEPELMNDSPYEEGWIAEIKLSKVLNKADYMTYEQYQEFTSTLD